MGYHLGEGHGCFQIRLVLTYRDNGVDYNVASEVLNAQYVVEANKKLSKFGYSVVVKKYSTLVYTEYGPVECIHLGLFLMKQ